MNIHNGARSGWPNEAMNDEMTHTVLHIVESDHRLTINDIQHALESKQCINISRMSIHRILQEEGFHKVCACCVRRLLTADYHKQCLTAALTFWTDYLLLSILTRIVTNDETWIYYSTESMKKKTMV